MGLNDYKTYDKQLVDSYTARLNEARATPGEKRLRRSTEALPPDWTMRPMLEVEQHVKYMQEEIGEAHFLTMETQALARQLDRPMKALDIGTFTGDSAGALAKGMENGGKVITVDITDKYQPLAEQFWNDEDVSRRIEQHILPLNKTGYGGARELLDKLVSDPANHETFDIAFIDGNKLDYEYCYNQIKKLLRPGGKIFVDNPLWSGRSALPDNHPLAHESSTDALRSFNEMVKDDPEVNAVFMNNDDGMWIVEKNGGKAYIQQARKAASAGHAGPAI